jgi:hypothetical protein
MPEVVVDDKVLDYARERFREDLENCLDDISVFFGPLDNPCTLMPSVYIAAMRELAKALSLDFDALIAELGTPFEIERFREVAELDTPEKVIAWVSGVKPRG